MIRRLLPFLLVVLMAPYCWAAMQPVMKQRVGTPPHLVLKSILTTNSNPPSPKQNAATPTNQAPYITWLADSDSRLEASRILPATGNHIYAVRNLANQLITAQGSVDYGIHFLHTPVLLITGNSDSEAISLFLQQPQALPATIRTELDHLLLPALATQAARNNKERSLGGKQLSLVEHNVDFQVELAIQRYAQRIKNDRLVVIGAVYDLANSYGHGKNSLQIININGETNLKKMRQLQLLKPIPPSLLTTLGRAKKP